MDSDIDGMGISPCNPAMMRPAVHKNKNCLSGIARGRDCVLLVDGIASRRDEPLSPDTCLDRLVIDEQDEGIGPPITIKRIGMNTDLMTRTPCPDKLFKIQLQKVKQNNEIGRIWTPA